jgi:hypothetical protein
MPRDSNMGERYNFFFFKNMSLDVCKRAGLPYALLALIEEYYGLPDGWFLFHRFSSMEGSGGEFGFFTMHSAMLELIEEMEEENDENIYLWNVVDGKTTRFLTPLENLDSLHGILIRLLYKISNITMIFKSIPF